jgi:ABC-type polysaccharide/polyol phosphate transport system ATPase subunit
MLLSGDNLLEVRGVSKRYSRSQTPTRRRLARQFVRALVGLSPPADNGLREGEFWSLRNISFTLERGKALGIIGLNGAGKTTLLRILAGQILPDAGDIRMLGQPASMIDLTAGFQLTASGRRNIYLRGAMLGRRKAEIDQTLDEIIDFAELGDAIDAPVSTYSSGMLMRLAFSIMITSKPDILFVDEILSVGDFTFRQKCLSRIRAMREQTAFVLVSHSMGDIKLFCDSVIVLRKGEIAFQGPPAEAIDFYEHMQQTGSQPEAQKGMSVVGPQFENSEHISDVEHWWCDESGNPIREIVSAAPLCLRARFRLSYVPRELTIGIPVWRESGECVTGFSTEIAPLKINIEPGRLIDVQLNVPSLPFNPGTYLSNLAVTDGLEFLYRRRNADLIVKPRTTRYWGSLLVEHSWHTRNNDRDQKNG